MILSKFTNMMSLKARIVIKQLRGIPRIFNPNLILLTLKNRKVIKKFRRTKKNPCRKWSSWVKSQTYNHQMSNYNPVIIKITGKTDIKEQIQANFHKMKIFLLHNTLNPWNPCITRPLNSLNRTHLTKKTHLSI